MNETGSDRYADIIGLEHPEPDPLLHPRMSRRDRAAQFAPFAALTGFGDLISDAVDLHDALDRTEYSHYADGAR